MMNTEIELTDGMRRALLAVRSTRQGGSAHGATTPVMRELFAAGLIGRSGGLTRTGSILAARLRRQVEEAAFA